MPEPLTVATGVTALIHSAYTLCFSIYQKIDDISNAPKHIKAISRDLKAFYSVLATLKGYIDDVETSPGVLHPATSTDLEAVLANSVIICKDLNTVVNGYIEHSCTQDITWWHGLRWTWKEKEVGTLRAHLADHKRTLNIAIAAANFINTSTTNAATQRIEEDIRELKTTLTSVLERLERDQERYQECGVILDNYGAAIQRFARGADSIMTAYTLPERPPSSSPVVSSLEPSFSCSTYITAPSCRTGDLVASVISRSTYETAQLHPRAETRLASPKDVTSSDAEPTSIIELPFETAPPQECQQLFVKGLAAHTIVLSSLESPICVDELKHLLFHETGIPKAFITLLHRGKRLEDHHSLTSHKISHNSTLQGYTHTVGKRDFRDELVEREMRDILFSELSSLRSTTDEASLGYYARKESTRQRLYTNYLSAKASLVRLPWTR